jgi:hypothetical protein
MTTFCERQGHQGQQEHKGKSLQSFLKERMIEEIDSKQIQMEKEALELYRLWNLYSGQLNSNPDSSVVRQGLDHQFSLVDPKSFIQTPTHHLADVVFKVISCWVLNVITLGFYGVMHDLNLTREINAKFAVGECRTRCKMVSRALFNTKSTRGYAF